MPGILLDAQSRHIRGRIELAKKKYAELKAYFENEHEKEQKECTEI